MYEQKQEDPQQSIFLPFWTKQIIITIKTKVKTMKINSTYIISQYAKVVQVNLNYYCSLRNYYYHTVPTLSALPNYRVLYDTYKYKAISATNNLTYTWQWGTQLTTK